LGALTFAAGEYAVGLARGQALFLTASARSVGLRLRSIRPMFTLVGEVAPVLLPMALAALGAARRWIVLACAVLAATYVLIALDLRALTLPGAAGIAIWIAVAAAIWRAWRALPTEAAQARRDLAFLAGWLAIELAAAIMLPPFTAARRFCEAFAVAALLLAAIAARHAIARPGLRVQVRWLVAFAAATGLFFEIIDGVDAWNVRRAAETAAVRARELAGTGATWFRGIHGFAYYAQRAGLQLANPYDSVLHAGDVLVIESMRDLQVPHPPPGAQLIEARRVGVALPVRTVLPFYVGWRSIDYTPADERGVELQFYRVTVDGPVVQD
jgi:hypothetical protein